MDTPAKIKDILTLNNYEYTFRWIVNTYRDKVCRFISLFVRNDFESEELASDVFVLLWKNRSEWERIENWDSYIFILARNTAFNHLRKKELPFVDLENLPVDTFYNTQTTPESIFISQEMVARLNKAIDELPQKTKLAFHLVRENKMKYKEAAQVLGVSAKTIEKQVAAAVAKLRELLDEKE